MLLLVLLGIPGKEILWNKINLTTIFCSKQGNFREIQLDKSENAAVGTN